MKYIIILFLFCIQNCFSQEITILSKNDKKPIPFANVIYLKNDSIKGGNYTNENGKILLDLKPEINFLEISCIGFETLKIERKNIQSSIFLEENATHLQEINVSDKKPTTQYLGQSFASRFHCLTQAIGNGYESITLIENPFSAEKEVKSFYFYLEKYDNLLPIFRIVFYKNENNIPTKAYPQNIHENIFTLTEKQKRKIKLDIRKMNVVLPKEGFFVGIECLGMIDSKTKEIVDIQELYKNMTPKKFIMTTGIAYNSSKKQTYSFEKHKFRREKWIDVNSRTKKTPLKFVGNEFLSPTFGIEVYE